LFITRQNYLFASRDGSLSFAYLISLGKLAAIWFSIYGSRKTGTYIGIYKKIGARAFLGPRALNRCPREKGIEAVIILPNCLRTHLCTYILNRVEHKRLVGGTCAEQARGVCAINPGAQNFHSPAFIVSEQHLTDVSARGCGGHRLVCMQPRAPWLLTKLELYYKSKGDRCKCWPFFIRTHTPQLHSCFIIIYYNGMLPSDKLCFMALANFKLAAIQKFTISIEAA